MTTPANLLAEARYHTGLAVAALIDDADRSTAVRQLALFALILHQLVPGQPILTDGFRHMYAAIAALDADDQVEAMHQLAQLDTVLDRIAVGM